MFDNEIDTPIVTKPKLNEADALWWADRAREITSTSAVHIVHETTNWLTERLPETTGPRTERAGVEYGAEVNCGNQME